jgi:hypothetical protein
VEKRTDPGGRGIATFGALIVEDSTVSISIVATSFGGAGGDSLNRDCGPVTPKTGTTVNGNTAGSGAAAANNRRREGETPVVGG